MESWQVRKNQPAAGHRRTRSDHYSETAEDYVEAIAAIEPRRQPHHFAEAVDDGQLTMVVAGDKEMEAVGPEVDGGQKLRRRRAGWMPCNDAFGHESCWKPESPRNVPARRFRG